MGPWNIMIWMLVHLCECGLDFYSLSPICAGDGAADSFW